MAFRKLFDNRLFENRAPLVLRWSDDQLKPLVDRLAPLMPGLTYQMQLAVASVARSIVTEKMVTGRGLHYARAKEPDRLAATAPGRRAMFEHFEKQVDPDGALSEKERAKLAENARAAHLAGARRKALKVIRERQEAAAMGDR